MSPARVPPEFGSVRECGEKCELIGNLRPFRGTTLGCKRVPYVAWNSEFCPQYAVIHRVSGLCAEVEADQCKLFDSFIEM